MLSKKKTSIQLWSNNRLLEDSYFLCQSETLEFKKYSRTITSNYLLIHLDLEEDLANTTSNLFPLLSSVSEKGIKVLACLSLSSGNKTSLLEKYLGIFNSLYEKKINIRTLVIYDLYTLDPNNLSTSLDKYISNTIATKNLKISKVNNICYYPISLKQCLPSYEKLLFLNSTQSKNYYLSGQPTKDSDFAYFLNKTYQELFFQG